jgi:hypothetical protein
MEMQEHATSSLRLALTRFRPLRELVYPSEVGIFDFEDLVDQQRTSCRRYFSVTVIMPGLVRSSL